MGGPRLWDKTISVPSFDETELSIMNIDDFLNENNINLDDDATTGQQQQGEQQQQLQQQQVDQEQKMGGKQHSPNSQSSYEGYENMITMNQNAFLSGGMAAMSVEDVGEESLDEDEEDRVEVSAAGVPNDNKQQQRQQGLKRKNNLPK